MDRKKGAEDKRKGFTPLYWTLAALIGCTLLFGGFGAWQPIPPKTLETLLLSSIEEVNAVDVQSLSPGKLQLSFELRKNSYIAFKLNTHLHNTQVHLEFSRLEEVRQIRIYPKMKGKPYLRKLYVALPTGNANGIRMHYKARLPDGDYERLRIDFEGGGHIGRATLKKISLHPTGIMGENFWTAILAVAFSMLVILPGIFLFCLLHKDAAEDDGLHSFFMVYSVGYYLVAWLLWMGWNRLGFPGGDIVTAVFVLGAIPALCLTLLRGGRRENLNTFLRKSRKKLVVFGVAVTATAILISYDTSLPLENTWYSTTTGPKAYRAFGAHDAIFQYVNGFAISNNEPFEKYYGNRRLIYGVEDRGILPGVIYAVFRCVLRNFSMLLAESFLIYTLIGIVFNAMVLFPVVDFAVHYLRLRKIYIFCLGFSLNAFIIVNYYLSWYKMAGTAFFLCGLYLLLGPQRCLRRWGLAGLAWGIGSSMHAGSALGIPFFFLWALWRDLRDRKQTWWAALAGPLLLVIVFSAVNLPWSMIKQSYFHDRQRLFKEHFLAGHSRRGGLVPSAMRFFQKIPLSEQLPYRLERCWKSLRFAEVNQLFDTLQEGKTEDFYRLWNKFEFAFTAFVLYPAMVLWALSLIGSRRRKNDLGHETVAAATKPSAATLAWLSVATLAVITFLSYGSHPPDLTYHQPMAVIVLLYLVMLGQALVRGWIGMCAAGGYFVFAGWRLLAFQGG